MFNKQMVLSVKKGHFIWPFLSIQVILNFIFSQKSLKEEQKV
ncbi:hypothetical protein ACIRA0001_2985 [Acinetobacter radioresistens SK82]|uniref:Transposase n=1 Tax=Acinetobacter radioresistens SK82 TaxID=596318 RepID=A0ABP2GKP3_ACIRA|nr:hypothetical protein ACIRA0001_2985 [Acinetobacter radioresistens SK82]EEY85667.1 hypothetical protein HMPREF0018_02247 [Acinetobacter radioresistens SH164]EXB80948.1 hypothetical protein J538_2834 [Acinetobacter sp. 272263]